MLTTLTAAQGCQPPLHSCVGVAHGLRQPVHLSPSSRSHALRDSWNQWSADTAVRAQKAVLLSASDMASDELGSPDCSLAPPVVGESLRLEEPTCTSTQRLVTHLPDYQPSLSHAKHSIPRCTC